MPFSTFFQLFTTTLPPPPPSFNFSPLPYPPPLPSNLPLPLPPPPPPSYSGHVSTPQPPTPPTNVKCLVVRSKQGNAELHSAAINKGSLVPPAQTLMMYPKLQTEGNASKLAVKLARESFFGENAMARCTLMGCGKYPALPSS